jgi:hypothetical protein
MPKQETFFEQTVGGRRIEVVKSYDQAYARQAFRSMDGDALQRLWTSLKLEEIYDPAGLPALNDPEGEGDAFLWDELLEQAREDGPVLSFFIVNEWWTATVKACSCHRTGQAPRRSRQNSCLGAFQIKTHE